MKRKIGEKCGGYIKRRQILFKDLLEENVGNNRQRGKSRTNWEENTNTWSGMALQQCTRKADNRDVGERMLQSTSKLEEDTRIAKCMLCTRHKPLLEEFRLLSRIKAGIRL